MSSTQYLNKTSMRCLNYTFAVPNLIVPKRPTKMIVRLWETKSHARPFVHPRNVWYRRTEDVSVFVSKHCLRSYILFRCNESNRHRKLHEVKITFVKHFSCHLVYKSTRKCDKKYITSTVLTSIRPKSIYDFWITSLVFSLISSWFPD